MLKLYNIQLFKTQVKCFIFRFLNLNNNWHQVKTNGNLQINILKYSRQINDIHRFTIDVQ